eukprot:gene23396-29612_t
METSDLLQFPPLDISVEMPLSPGSPVFKKKSDTPNRRETADQTDIGDLLGALEDDHTNDSMNSSSSFPSSSSPVMAFPAMETEEIHKKDKSASNRRETADFNDLDSLMNGLDESNGSITSDSSFAPPVAGKTRRETADFGGFESLLDDLSVDQSTLSVAEQSVESPTTAAAIAALNFSKAVMSGKKSSMKTVKSASASSKKKSRRNSTGSVDIALSPPSSPLRAARLASPSPRRSPRFTESSVDFSISADNTLSSNGSSLFAGFGGFASHNSHNERRNTADFHDMQDMLNDLSGDDFTATSIAAVPAPQVIVEEEAAQEVEEEECDNTMNTLQLRENMSELLGQSTTSNAPSMDLLYSSTSSAEEVPEEVVESTTNLDMSVLSDLSMMSSVKEVKKKSGRKSIGKRRETVGSTDILDLMDGMDDDEEEEKSHKHGGGRRSTVDAGAIEDLLNSSLSSNKTGVSSALDASSDSVNTYALVSSVEASLSQQSPAKKPSSKRLSLSKSTSKSASKPEPQVMSLTQEAVENHNAKNRRLSKGGDKSGKKSKRGTEDMIEPTVTVTNNTVDRLVISDATNLPAAKRRVTMDGTSLEALDMFLLDEHVEEGEDTFSVSASPAPVKFTAHHSDEEEDGGESVVAFDNSIFNDTMSQLSAGTYQTDMAYQNEMEILNGGESDKFGAISEVEDDGASFDDNATVDAREVDLLNMSSNTLDSFCTVGTYDLVNQVEFDLLNASNEVLNASDMTCGTVGSLGGWLAAAEELVAESQTNSQPVVAVSSQSDVGISFSSDASSMFSPSAKRSKKDKKDKSSKRLSHAMPSVMESPATSKSSKKLRLAKSPSRLTVPPVAMSSPGMNSSFSVTVPNSILKSCMSVSKYPRQMQDSFAVPSSARKGVVFGSPKVAEFNKLSPTTNMTPMDKKAARQMFSMQSGNSASDNDLTTSVHGTAQNEEDAITAANSQIMEEWDRLTNVSGNSDEAASPDFTYGSSSKKSRRRHSKLQHKIDISASSDEDLSAVISEPTKDYLTMNLDDSAFSECTKTVDLPSNMMEMLQQNDVSMDMDEVETPYSEPFIPTATDSEDENQFDLSTVSATVDLEECDLGSLMRDLMPESTRPSKQRDGSHESADGVPLSLQELSRSNFEADSIHSANSSQNDSNDNTMGNLMGFGDFPAAEDEEQHDESDYSGGESLRLSVSSRGNHSDRESIESVAAVLHTQKQQQQHQELDVSVMSSSSVDQDDNTCAILQRHASQRAQQLDSSMSRDDMTATLETDLGELFSGLEQEEAEKATKSTKKRPRKSDVLNTSVSHYVDNEVSFIVRTASNPSEVEDNDADEVSVAEEVEEEEVTKEELSFLQDRSQAPVEEEEEEEGDLSTATTLVDDHSQLVHDISALVDDVQEHFVSDLKHRQSVSGFDTSFEFMNTSINSDANTSVLKPGQSQSILARLQNLKASSHENALKQCATPATKAGSSRLSISQQNNKRLSITASAVKAPAPIALAVAEAPSRVVKKPRMSLGPESGPFSRQSTQEAVAPVVAPVAAPVVAQSQSIAKPSTASATMDVSMNMSLNDVEFDDEEENDNEDTIEIPVTAMEVEQSEVNTSVVYSEEVVEAYSIKLRHGLERYLSVVDSVRKSLTTYDTHVQSLVVSILQTTMRTSHIQTEVSKFISYETLDAVWAMSTEAETAAWVDEQVTVTVETAKKCFALEEEKSGFVTLKQAEWERCWLDLASVSILELFIILKESPTATVAAPNVVSTASLSQQQGDEKFYSKALSTPARRVSEEATARKNKLLATMSKVSSANEVSVGVIAAQKEEERVATERRLVTTNKMKTITNYLTYCKVVEFGVSLIQVNVALSRSTQVTLKFNMARSAVVSTRGASTNTQADLCVTGIKCQLDTVSTRNAGAYQAVEDVFVHGYFASVLQDSALCGPFSEKVLSRVVSPAHIPLLLRKISASVASLRVTLVNLKTLHRHTAQSFNLTVHEQNVSLKIKHGKEHAVMSIRQFVSQSSEKFATKESCVSPSLWTIESTEGDSVSEKRMKRTFEKMETQV